MANKSAGKNRRYDSCFKIHAFGFTLLETMVALTVIVSAMAGPFALATRGIFSARFAKNKLVAVNLAQESIELVRKLRDDNVLTDRAWDFNIGIGEESNWQMDILSDSLLPFTNVPLRRDPTSGIYNHLSGDETLFTRRITVRKPADNQMLVIAHVTWKDAGISRSMVLQETLYHWR